MDESEKLKFLSGDTDLSQDAASQNEGTRIMRFERQRAGAADDEAQAKKIPFPKAVFFIIGNEFCERYTYYGMRTVLTLYLKNYLGFSSDTTTIIFHMFTMLVYTICVAGAIISDSWLGKFKTIFYLSIVYACGNITMSIGAIPQFFDAARALTFTGIALIAAGSGGIKPCVSAFGGDHFILPDQAKQLSMYFSMFYFSINAGALLTAIVSPILRDDVQCFGRTDCNSLAYGVPALLMIVAIAIFLAGRPYYRIIAPAGNIITSISKTVFFALSTKIKEGKSNPRDHWLDYADKKYDPQLIADIKRVGRIMFVFIGVPMFWALYDQKGSRWVLQAERMNGEIGSWQMAPDHMQTFNPLMILILIPINQFAIYPLLKKIGIYKLLHKMIIGGMLAAASFIITGILQLSVEKTFPVMPLAGQTQLRIFNGDNCAYTFQTNIPDQETFDIEAFGYFEYKDISVDDKEFELNYKIKAKTEGAGCSQYDDGSYSMAEKTAQSLFMASQKLSWYKEHVDKPQKGHPLARVLANVEDGSKVITKHTQRDIVYETSIDNRELAERVYGKYKIFIDNTEVMETRIKTGGVYTFIIAGSSKAGYTAKAYEITEPNSLHMMWQLPEYLVLTQAEVMFSINTLEFAYSEAPISMKAFVAALNMLAIAMGSLIVIVLAKIITSDSMATQFFFFSGFMVADMLLLMLLAYFYYKWTRSEKV